MLTEVIHRNGYVVFKWDHVIDGSPTNAYLLFEEKHVGDARMGTIWPIITDAARNIPNYVKINKIGAAVVYKNKNARGNQYIVALETERPREDRIYTNLALARQEATLLNHQQAPVETRV
jgi:hypothetical protein